MAYVYSVTGEKIALSLSPNDIGVRFETPDIAARAFRSVRASVSAPRGTGPGTYQIVPRRFDRTLLLHEPGAARTAFSTVRSALSTRLATNVRRTLPVYIEEESKLRVIVTREITVRFKPKVSESQRTKLLKGIDLMVRDVNEFIPRQFIVIPSTDVDESETIRLANRLAESDAVEYAAPNFVSEHLKLAATNDRLLADQWHLNNTGADGAVAGEDVKAFAAWDITPGGSPDIIIAIVDDGVDIGHADLRSNIWTNPDPAAPDRNGRNYFDNDYDPRPRHFRRPYDDTDTNDIHGTPCAGVAAAVGNNRSGVAGIAYNCKILPVKIFGGEGLAPLDRVADAIRYSGRHAHIISNSWSVPRNPDVESAINEVVRTGRGGKGCLVFCATGNEYEPRIAFPANHQFALAVGASNDQAIRSDYSNYGQGIEFVAPSSDPDRDRPGITTTDVSATNRGYNPRGSYVNDFGGTSSATPLAAGIAALVLSVDPSLTWERVRDILRSSADKIDPRGGAYRDGYSRKYGYGRLNAHEAVRKAQASAARRSRSSTKARKGAKKRATKARKR